MAENIIKVKSFSFALRVVKLYQFLNQEYQNCQELITLFDLSSHYPLFQLFENKYNEKKKVKIEYETIEEPTNNKCTCFRCFVLLDDKKIVNASETSKKKAEEKAAQRAFYTLNKKEQILEK